MTQVKLATSPAQLIGSALSRASQLATGSLSLPFRPDEVYRVPTDDGAAIILGRYHPREQRRFAEPVILCHGLAANRYTFDFDERYSLARHLARRGFETWVVELRGRELSGPAGSSTFDDQAHYDVAAALRTVRSSGAPAVTWVGHSKGGLLLYAHLARNPDAPVRAAVAIGSPVSFAFQPGLRRFIRTIHPGLSLEIIPIGSVARSMAVFGAPPRPFSQYLIRAANMDPEIIRRAVANVAADIPGGVARQFAHWMASGKFASMDGTVDYLAEMKRIRIPLMLLAGSHDLLAPPPAVAVARDHLGGPVKLVVAGKDHGFTEDYGHGDLILGRHAPTEVFPLVEGFLAAHSSAC